MNANNDRGDPSRDDAGSEVTAEERSVPARTLWFLIGFTALALGAIGAVLPLLPTTPFVLVSAWAFARSSRRWHDWLLRHRVFGPLILDWRRYGAISPRAKIAAAVALVAVLVLSLLLGASTTVLTIQATVLSASAAFIFSRPSPPPR
ncbi:MAG: YbaN family protein [Pseudomonadota bacterium]